jgi:hypothetical protein
MTMVTGLNGLRSAELDGADLRRRPLEERTRQLAELLRTSKPGLPLNGRLE